MATSYLNTHIISKPMHIHSSKNIHWSFPMDSQHGNFVFHATLSLLLLCCYVAMAAAAVQNNNNNDMSTDKSALVSLMRHISYDPNNVIAKNWSSTTSVCNWIGITCAFPSSSSSKLRVTSLNLSYMGLVGTIPPHIGNLSFLAYLTLQNNSFQGNLPHEMARLHRLKVINLCFNNFIGKIPSWFVSMPKLKTILLARNGFTGTVPDSLFNITSLRILELDGNKLSDSLPWNFFLAPSLEYVDLADNQISGPVPSTMLNDSALQLQVIDLANNNMSRELPEHIFHHLPNLEELYLFDNRFSGELPTTLFSCKKLNYLYLSYNSFTGNIPRGIGNLTRLKVIFLGFNKFSGAIPYEIGNLHNLEFLELDFANLTGSIPQSIFNISTIYLIAVAGNHLSGSLPTNLGSKLPKLEWLSMGDNYLSGRIPSSLSNATMLTLIDLPLNSFSGYIPDIFSNLKSLEWLNLDQNNLTVDSSNPERGFISSLTSCRYLRELSLIDNSFDAILPISIGNLSNSLVHLNLEGCSIRGNIPASVGNLSSLIFLDLGRNRFSGTFPAQIGKLQKLQGLSLRMNQLEGFLPLEFCQLKNIDSLNLGNNRFSGPIPSCLSNLTSLRQLSIPSNAFNSTPSTLWGLSDLLLLDLSINNLKGPLPLDIGNLRSMTWMYLSENQLSGSIPSSIGNLDRLTELNLQQNEFEGHIPESFGSMVSLEALDLSENNLCGVIPTSLEALVYLHYFNVSYNKLKGEIPDGGPFANFSAESFIGNEELCGAPHLRVPECKKGKSQKKVTYFVLKCILPAAVATVLLVAFLCVLNSRKRRTMKNSNSHQSLARGRRISYYEIQQATNWFNEGNLLGTGSFGRVFKGVLSDGMNVAIKVFRLEMEGAFKSFDVECEVLRNVRHRNLTKIISSVSNTDFKALVLSYMSNESLEKWLHSAHRSLSIIQRLNIMIDVAEALDYLHHGGSVPIVHCDLKPSNVLLDEDMVAHVTDFGIAKLLSGGDSITQTMTLATMGYMAPEYGLEGSVSRQGDVYSYGILLMETFTQKKPTDEMFVGEFSIKQWVKMSYTDSLFDIIDAKLLNEEGREPAATMKECLSSIMELALDCSAESPRERTNMRDVIASLKKIKGLFLS